MDAYMGIGLDVLQMAMNGLVGNQNVIQSPATFLGMTRSGTGVFHPAPQAGAEPSYPRPNKQVSYTA